MKALAGADASVSRCMNLLRHEATSYYIHTILFYIGMQEHGNCSGAKMIDHLLLLKTVQLFPHSCSYQ